MRTIDKIHVSHPSGRSKLLICACLLAAAVMHAPVSTFAASLPFRALDDETSRFTASALTASYEHPIEVLLDSERKAPTDLDVLDEHGWFPMDDVPYRPDTHDMFQWAEEEIAPDPLSPEEKVAGESGTAGVQVGIPSPVAVTGALLGGIGLLASILVDWF